MIHALIPYYHEDSPAFARSLSMQTGYVEHRFDRRKGRVYWTRAMNELMKEVPREAVVCILNNDLELCPDLFEIGARVRPGEVLIPQTRENGKTVEWGLEVDWSRKKFFYGERIDVFSPRGIFINARDVLPFRRSLPHYLADYDWAFRLLKNGVQPIRMNAWVNHTPNTVNHNLFSPLNPRNPIFWTVFLWFNCPRNLFVENLARSWFIFCLHRDCEPLSSCIVRCKKCGKILEDKWRSE